MLVIDLQLLAADSETLLRAYGPPVEAFRAAGILNDDFANITAEDLANDFQAYVEDFGSEKIVAEGLITREMLEKVRRVDAKLDEMSGPQDPELWTDEGLRTREEWNVVRRFATEALEAMGYDVDLPPPWSGKVVPARGQLALEDRIRGGSAPKRQDPL